MHDYVPTRASTLESADSEQESVDFNADSSADPSKIGSREIMQSVL